jgi:transcription antitermination factor NusG
MAHMPLDASVMAAVDTAEPDLRCYSIRWACVYTQPQAERWAKTNLELVGYRVWFPTRIVMQRDPVIPTKLNPAERPLFPRYGFIAFDHRDTSWSPIRDTPGVVDLVRCGSLPAYTNATVVERLQAVQELAATPQPETSQWAPGVPCSPATGAFAGHPAVVVEVRGERAEIAMLLFGELRRVLVDVRCLVARE